ncbi:cytochrome c-type biogenesis protein CcmH [Marinobacter sp. 71-i]|uniref:Cytochrome c-type biogenesis protein n=1 Tax=Marinobacter iranensis TaxID=2962607 RepID=A0ABT5Y692_9GAMM|nr:cytochrome c-type biogenesis protein [Marinobacter iranensis]MDF0749081.1 cytochrome c-type biogenesis protein CcmH [Marinobacter iranensis]
MLRSTIALALLFMLVPFALADDARDVYGFESQAQEQRFQSLISELRCPKCQNQNIADSNAPISKDMREEVYRMMSDGASNEEIVGALVDRFGEFVRYKPEVDSRTILLWATPAIVVFGGLLVVAGIIIRSRRSDQSEPALTDEERARASRILDGDDSDRSSG